MHAVGGQDPPKDGADGGGETGRIVSFWGRRVGV